ncbi:DUF4352 domain-containing protein [Streptomyces sp. ISL-43]|uniref:DUF4352 domain-containing protein n=1 Tax=Streptomyces sp. ISL-43 TaxID=2819183 RepID=UPI001BE66D98|nr:DUF4352 domain-containing protein [Streptomyces sp. ISL-43]MBT2452846.1 DUF4352 domain-containing protein [Streptomyces sp. ISL-43]
MLAAIGGGGDEEKGPAPAVPAPSKAAPKTEWKPQVEITATKAEFKPTVLHQDGKAYTAVLVTVTNHSSKKPAVNPMYFDVTDSTGVKHSAELAGPEDGLQHQDLYGGER